MFIKALMIGLAAALGSQEPQLSCNYANKFCEKETHILFDAVRDGDIPAIFESAKLGLDMGVHNYEGQTPLHVSVDVNSTDAMTALIKSGAWVNADNSQYQTALHLAAKAGHEAQVELLRRAGANLDQMDLARNTALHYAAILGHTKVIEALTKEDPTLPNSAEINSQNNFGETPVFLAARHGKEESLLALINAGADVFKQNNNDRTPKYIAELSGYKKIVTILEEAEKDKIKTQSNSYWPWGWKNQ